MYLGIIVPVGFNRRSKSRAQSRGVGRVGRLLSSTTFGITGEDQIGGLQFDGAVTKLGSDEAMSVLTPEFL